MRTIKLERLHRRLMPLYIATFLQSAVFWYATEKVFMTSIGFNSATIGLMVIIMSVFILLLETPSGIVADRWSRKNVAIIGAISLGICTLMLALSQSIPVYIIGSLFWGGYNALYSGTYESMLYDTVKEEHQSSDRFQHVLGTMRVVEGSAFSLGAIIGGIIAASIGLRETFYFSIPLVAVSIFFIRRFHEPQLHKAEGPDPILSHITKTLSAILHRRFLVPALIASVSFAAVVTTTFELSQLWFIEIGTPVVWFGVIAAFLYATWGLGGLVSKHILSKRSAVIFISLVPTACYAVIAVSRSGLVTFLAQFVACAALVALGVLLLQYIHDNIPSKLRAGSASLIGTLTRMTIIPLTLVFTTIAQQMSIYSATYVLFGFVIVASIAMIQVQRRTSISPKHPAI